MGKGSTVSQGHIVVLVPSRESKPSISRIPPAVGSTLLHKGSRRSSDSRTLRTRQALVSPFTRIDSMSSQLYGAGPVVRPASPAGRPRHRESERPAQARRRGRERAARPLGRPGGRPPGAVPAPQRRPGRAAHIRPRASGGSRIGRAPRGRPPPPRRGMCGIFVPGGRPLQGGLPLPPPGEPRSGPGDAGSRRPAFPQPRPARASRAPASSWPLGGARHLGGAGPGGGRAPSPAPGGAAWAGEEEEEEAMARPTGRSLRRAERRHAK